MGINDAIRNWLKRTGDFGFSAYVILAAFSTYFCMYAFRKPFSAAEFSGIETVSILGLPELNYKIALIIAQVMGYMFSKFYGIKLISELAAKYRAMGIVILILIAESALLLFAITPQPWNILFLFLNGIPLGMVWGMVFGFLEGRKLTEALGAGLSTSYIVASGAVKTVGRWVMDYGVSEFWMPFVVGLIFFPILLTAVGMLRLIPPPTAEDEQLRTHRQPMYAEDRHRFLKEFFPGLFFLTFLYMFLTAYRDFRDNFAAEIWSAVGYGKEPTVFTTSETAVAVGVLMVLGVIFLIRSNRNALNVIMSLMIGGSILIGVATAAFQAQLIGPLTWMVLIGLGLYIAYVPYGAFLFERLIAALHYVGTAGFMIYVTDAFGYLGSVGLLLYKNFGSANLPWLEFFTGVSYFTSIVCTVCFVLAWVYFSKFALPRARAAAGVVEQPG